MTAPFTTKNKLFTDTCIPGRNFRVFFCVLFGYNKELNFTQKLLRNMPKNFLAGLLLACATLTLTMCKKESTATYDCTTVTPTYNNDIKAIMNASCAISGCHDASSREAGINLSTYATVKAESANDRFLGSMEHLSGYRAMPEGASKLADASLQKIYCWIQNGQPE